MNKHICSFTVDCRKEVHKCPYVNCCNHCKEHCWYKEWMRIENEPK